MAIRAKQTVNPLAVAALCIAPALAAAQSYPVKPVRMIAPFPPGGTSDVVGRLIGQKLTESLGRQVVVENRGGAAANIGHEIAARTPPDGYTLLLTSGAAMVTNQFLYKKLGWEPADFAPVSLIASAGLVLVVHPSVPATSVKQLIALAKARPDRMSVGSGGIGTTAHIVSEVFKSIAQTKITHVPYKGGALAVTDLVGGQIDMVFSDMVPSVPQVQSGRLRALAVTSEQRSNVLPRVPTMAESGVKQPFPSQWWAIVVPRGTPAAIISRLNADIGQFMKAPDIHEKYSALGLFPRHSTPEQVLDTIRTGTAEMREIVKAAGIQPE
jgi:tripartite-type tricarboxylate transporter receptor subunit TctC